jgi:DNA-directed RNA polymerase specialized sigma24 family protein
MPTGSVTQWLQDLKDGDPDSAQLLWERYFDRLTQLARKRIGGIARLATDGEDVALSAFHCLCEGVGEGRFADLADRESLWKLLVTIAVRKAQRAIRDEFTQKRGGGCVVGESAMMSAEEASAGVHVLERVLGSEPTPEFAAQVAEEWQGLLNRLGDDELRRIAIWKMEGCTSNEIAQRLGKSLATVERRLKLIRMAWSESDNRNN